MNAALDLSQYMDNDNKNNATYFIRAPLINNFAENIEETSDVFLDVEAQTSIEFFDALEKKKVTTRTLKTTRIQPVVRETFVAEQEWEGVVIDVDDNSFNARLIDVSVPCDDEEIASFPINTIKAEQINQLQPGAIFRWSIGYKRDSSGTKEKESIIVFRRLPMWTKKEIEESDAHVEKLIKFFSTKSLNEEENLLAD